MSLTPTDTAMDPHPANYPNAQQDAAADFDLDPSTMSGRYPFLTNFLARSEMSVTNVI